MQEAIRGLGGKRYMLKLAAGIFMIIFLATGTAFSASQEEPADDGTMLMFVGQDIELLSIASRREEAPAQAPAVAEVVSREEFRSRGERTLSQILARTPGFSMAQKEWGSEPYLRGMSNSALFLYDTVPIGSELSKTLHPIDQELSLAAVKQVEIVRGPSSVLWGPDAFAGVVNVVPLSGKDFQGMESGALYSTPGEEAGGYVNLGHDAGNWDSFLSLSLRQGEEDKQKANLVSFFGDGDGDSRPVPVKNRFGSKKPGQARYLDAYANLHLGSDVALSGRFTDSIHPYSVKGQEQDLEWYEERNLDSGYLKLDINRDLNLESNYRLSAFYSRMRPEQVVIDKTLQQDEETIYAEASLERSLLQGKGLFTSGLAYRHKDIQDVPVWDAYIPYFLGPENKDFLPGLSSKDMKNQTWSLFAQYRHKLGDWEFMLGARQDWHQEYQDNLSYNAAAVWSPLQEWTFKLLYGTSYRSPFARQLLDEAQPDLEKSENYSLQALWNPRQNLELGATAFYNQVSEHATEDPFAGLSEPNEQSIYGLELQADYSPFAELDLNSSLTLLNNSGPEETFRMKLYTIVLPDGTVEEVYETVKYPFDPGPKSLFNLNANWRPWESLELYTGLRYFDSRNLLFPGEEQPEKASEAWLLDMAATYKDVFVSGLDLEVSVRNLLDKEYQTPGTYSMIEGEPFSAQIMLRYGF